MVNSETQVKETWKNINWRKVNRYVFKQQTRIYEASRRGEVRKVRQLQRTLTRSWYARLLAVRRVTQDNQGKKTAGIDGVKALNPNQRLKLASHLRISGKARPVRRVLIPKPGSTEKRPLGIPVMYDRAAQALLKLSLEPEWEARFEPTSYGFRPGRSQHDAIRHIKNALQAKPKYVLDADIAKCFDRIDHQALLKKMGYSGKTRRQLKAWLKAGVIHDGHLMQTEEGTPQGGVISPLLANIALDGINEMLMKFAETLPGKKRDNKKALTYIRFADDFVVIHKDKSIILKCFELIAEWLLHMGLELKPEKTRLAHTLLPSLSDDGIAGFKFLGFQIKQFKVSKYKGNRSTHGKLQDFDLYIYPTSEAVSKHQRELSKAIRELRNAPQEALLKELAPKVSGWCNYYKPSDAQTMGIASKVSHNTYLTLRKWSKAKTGSAASGARKYWGKRGDKKWSFQTKDAYLMLHDEYPYSSTQYVKVKGNRSPYDGDWVYWSARMGKHPEVKPEVARMLKKQKGKCDWCGQYFFDGDAIEIDHIIPKSCGGSNLRNNKQLLHRHCHDQKTTVDGSITSKTVRKSTKVRA